MKIRNVLPLILLSMGTLVQAQDFGIRFSGFVKNDFFWDSRQIVAAREGHFMLWPAAENLDVTGKDINAVSGYNFLSIQSRLSGNISGPDAFGAKTSGLIEGDFFAQANDNINLFRLRHAYLKLKWERAELILGQYWNPLFVTSCFPGTVSFNTGTPLQSFARNPQIRLNLTSGNLTLVGAALGQRDYTSRGAAGISSEYLRNSSLPDLHLQLHFQKDGFTSGAGIAYKSIVPRTSSTIGFNTYKVSERVGGLTAIAFAKISSSALTFKIQGRYGENIADVLSVSGFAVKEVSDMLTGEQEYTPLTNATFWAELHTNGKEWQWGVFGGYLKSLGTKEEMDSPFMPVYGLGTNIESLYRISPRVMLTREKTRFAAELEYTAAAYGSDYDSNYTPANTTTVANLRLLLSAYYMF